MLPLRSKKHEVNKIKHKKILLHGASKSNEGDLNLKKEDSEISYQHDDRNLLTSSMFIIEK